jgi:hypothetical protein
MKLNLSGVRRVAEQFMQDSCQIVRDVERTHDDIWDPVTGLYTLPAGDNAIVYDGQCMVSGQAGARQTIGGEYVFEQVYWLSIPLDSDPVLPLDRVVITESEDFELLDKKFIVDDQVFGTFTVSKRIKLRLLLEVPSG